MAANAGGRGYRFRDTALERRRPSKRQTTVRSFPVVRTWKTQPSSSSLGHTSTQDKEKSLSTPRVLNAPSMSSRPVAIPESPSGDDTVSSSAAFSSRRSIVIPRHSPTPLILTSPQALSVTQPAPSAVGQPSPEGRAGASPQPIVLASPQAEILPPASGSELPVAAANRTPDLSDKRPLSQKTPCSGPGSVKGAGRPKRKRTGAACETSEPQVDADYREKKFVRLFNADQGRSKSVSEITDLDVVLTSIEGVALDYRNEVQSAIGKQAIKEFFIQVRKVLTDRIDICKEHQLLKSDLRKVKAKITKCRKELLSVEQQRSRVKARLEKFTSQQHQKPSERQKELEEISKFLTDLELLERQSREALSSQRLSKKDYASPENLPCLLSEGCGLAMAGRHLEAINDSLELWLSKSTKR